LANFLLGDF